MQRLPEQSLCMPNPNTRSKTLQSLQVLITSMIQTAVVAIKAKVTRTIKSTDHFTTLSLNMISNFTSQIIVSITLNFKEMTPPSF